MKIILNLIFSLVLFESGFAQTYQLQLNLKKGETYNQNMISNFKINQTVQGTDMSIVMNVAGKISFLVTEVVNEEFVMEVTYQKLSMTMNMGQGDLMFSSDQLEDNNVVPKILSRMINKTFGMTYTKTGKVKNVKGLDLLFNVLLDDIPEMSSVQKEQLQQQLEKAYGAESLKNNLEMGSAIFPEASVAKGEKWDIVTNLKNDMNIKMTTKYQLNDVYEDAYIITGFSAVESIGRDSFMVINGIEMRYDMKGTMTSDIKLDKNTGWITEAKIHQEMQGKAEVKESEQIPGGMLIPMKLITEIWIN